MNDDRLWEEARRLKKEARAGLRAKVSTSNSATLLPCPFCGSSHILISHHTCSEPLIKDVHIVRCGTCNVSSYQFATRNNAIEAWNRRAS